MALVRLGRVPAQLDPIGATGAWSLAPLSGAIAVGYAVVQSVMHRSEIVRPELAIAAVVAIVAAAVVLTIAAHPSVGRLGRPAALIVVASAVLASVLSSMSTWGHNRFVQDDWGQIGIALLIFGMLWLRPPGELIVFGAVGAVVVGVLAAEQSGTLHIVNTPYVYAVVAATPVVVLTAVAATSGAIIARFAAEWSRSASVGMATLAPEVRQTEEAALHDAQLAELRHASLPLLASVVARGSITEADIAAATRTAAELRRHALQQVNLTWMDRLADEIGLCRHAIDDPDHLAPLVPARERAAVSACLIELVHLGLVDPGGVAIALSPSARAPGRAVFEARIRRVSQWRRLRRANRPFLSVLRSLSGDATTMKAGTTVTMRFGFDPA